MSDIELPYAHRQLAHCESGTISGLLTAAGLPISEPMAFGIGAGLTFAFLPFVKIGGLPLIAYRMPPGAIIGGLAKRLGVKMRRETFKDPAAGMRALDAHLEAGRLVGMQASVFWLDYFPEEMRFHFNAHNLIAHGKKGSKYLISDPTMPYLTECEAESLQKARFVRGALAPKGALYYPVSVPKAPDFSKAILKSIQFTTGMMLYTPVPLIGCWGIRLTAGRIRALKKADKRYAKLYIGHLVRMQEEIGTGGAGFRFIYAAFLNEAAQKLGRPAFADIARELTAAGDLWRNFALDAAKMCKDRIPLDFDLLADQLVGISQAERAVFKKLRNEVY